MTHPKTAHTLGRSAVAAPLTLLALAGSARGTTLLVPAYFYPGTQWAQLTAAGASITAIVNPDSGPGTVADPAYTAALTGFEAAGGTVIGYVSTDYGLRSAAAVEADVATYKSFYPINGIFLDQMTADAKAAHLAYYASLYSYIKTSSPGYDVVGNPGTAVPQSYAAVADTLVTYEGADATFAANVPAAWTTAASTPAGKSANIVYEAATAADMLAAVGRARAANVGDVYVTDDGADGNPYDSLPAYFNAEVAATLTTAAPEPALGPAMSLALAVVWASGRRRRPVGRGV